MKLGSRQRPKRRSMSCPRCHVAAEEDRLSHNLHRQLTEVVNGYVGRCDEDAARAGHCGRTKLCQKRCEQSQQKGKLFDHLVAL